MGRLLATIKSMSVSRSKNDPASSNTPSYLRSMNSDNDEKIRLTAAVEGTSVSSSTTNRDSSTIGEAIERLGCGFGSVLYCLGPYGFLMMEGAEVAVMSIVSLILECEWGLSTFWTSMIQIISLLSATIFGLLLSHLGDRFGRRRILILTSFGMIVSGVLSGLARNVWQMLICRALVGVNMGLGSGPAATYSAEIPTIKFRSLSLTSVGIGWGMGTALSSGLAFLTVGSYGWRGYLIMIAILCLPVLVLFFIARESPRYDVRVGNLENAQETLRSLSRLNCGKESLDFEIIEDQNCDEPDITSFYESYQVLRRTGYTSDFWKLVIFSLAGQFVYMAMIYVAPRFMDNQSSSNLNSFENEMEQNQYCSFDNTVLILFDLGVIGLADPISVAMAFPLVDKIGRRNLLFVSTVLPIFVMIPLYFRIPSSLMLVVLLVSRGSLAVFGWLNFVTGSEYFPTSIRSFTSSIVQACFCSAGVLSSFAVQYTYDLSSILIIAIMQTALLVAIFAIYSIKREMMGQQLEQ